MPEKFRSLVAVYVLVENAKSEMLLLRRVNTGYRDGYYDMPAGHLEEGETLRQAAVRELREETDIEAKPESLEFLELLHRRSGDRDYLDVFFRISSWNGDAKIMEPEKCDELIWVDKGSLPEMVVPHQREVLNHLDSGEKYMEIGWDGDLSKS